MLSVISMPVSDAPNPLKLRSVACVRNSRSPPEMEWLRLRFSSPRNQRFRAPYTKVWGRGG